ncbi:hypothetical protein PG993_005253 [Apiospora rasikravindrae]|uniref:Secreted protein n=1 Tax=Apiospora rasikravindrae TaxID=990691 RepID=A0ABR1THK9_9PEZI
MALAAAATRRRRRVVSVVVRVPVASAARSTREWPAHNVRHDAEGRVVELVDASAHAAVRPVRGVGVARRGGGGGGGVAARGVATPAAAATAATTGARRAGTGGAR